VARGRSFPARGRSGPKRLVSWLAPADQGFIGVASTAKVIVGSFTPALLVPSIDRATIVRTRGQVSVKFGAYTADLTIVGAVGMGVVSADAFAAGVASVPGPFSDADWDGWYMWRSFGYHWEVSAAGSTGQGRASNEFEVDSKAMRKIGTNEVCVIVAESQSGAFEINVPLRTLLKLS